MMSLSIQEIPKKKKGGILMTETRIKLVEIIDRIDLKSKQFQGASVFMENVHVNNIKASIFDEEINQDIIMDYYLWFIALEDMINHLWAGRHN